MTSTKILWLTKGSFDGVDINITSGTNFSSYISSAEGPRDPPSLGFIGSGTRCRTYTVLFFRYPRQQQAIRINNRSINSNAQRARNHTVSYHSVLESCAISKKQTKFIPLYQHWKKYRGRFNANLFYSPLFIKFTKYLFLHYSSSRRVFSTLKLINFCSLLNVTMEY